MNTLYPKIIVAHYKSIGVSMSESRVSSYSGDPTITNFKNQTELPLRLTPKADAKGDSTNPLT